MKYHKLFVALFFITINIFASEPMKYPRRQYQNSFTLNSPVIISPAHFMEKAEKLKAAMKKKGINDISLVEDKKAVKGFCRGLKDKWKKRPALIIGNLQENQALLQIYSRFLTNADSLTPGKNNGILIQFIPNRNSPGSHALIVAGSNQAGTEKAVDLLIEKIGKSKVCDWSKYVESDFKGKAKQAAVRILKLASGRYSKPQNNLINIYTLFQAYEISGDDKFVELAKESLLAAPENIWQTEGRDNHYGMGLPVRGWSGWARSGKISSELVQKIDQIFLNYLIKWENAWWRRKESSPVFSDNRHHVYGTWGYWQTARMLLDGLTDEQRKSRVGKFLMEKCEECESWFEACRKNYQQAALSSGVFINYTMFLLSAFQAGKTDIFENGGALKIAELAIGATDNTGGRAGISGYEDSYPGSVEPPYPIGAPICIANFFCQNRQLQWIRENLNGFAPGTWWELSSATHSYEMELASAYASAFIGFKPLFGSNKKPYFVSFRNGFKKNDLYLFITGNATCDINSGDSGKGRQVYPNMIARMSWNNTPWLLQNSNHKTAFHRNALLVDSAVKPTDVKGDMEVLFNGEKNKVYFFSGRAANYMNSEWTRSYIIVDNSFMIIEDKIKAESSGELSSILTWRSPYNVMPGKEEKELLLKNNAETLHIKASSCFDIDTEVRRLRHKEGALKPTVIRQYLNGELKENEAIRIFNLFYPSNEKLKQDFSIKNLTGDACLIKDNVSDEICIVGFGDFKHKNLAISGKAFFLGSKRFSFFGNGDFKIMGDKNLDSVLKELWTENVGKGKCLPAPEKHLKAIWTFDGFDKIWDKLTDFRYSSQDVKDLQFAFDGNIKRYRSATAAKGKPFEVLIDFEKPELLTEVEILSHSNNGKTTVGKVIPAKAVPIDIYNADGKKLKKTDVNTEAFWKLDESYKAETYTYTGAKAYLNERGEKFAISTKIPRAYQMNLYGGKKVRPEILEAKLVRVHSSQFIVLQSSNNELACLNAKDGKIIWEKKFPEILDMAIGDANHDGIDEMAIACRDKSVKRLEPKTGEIIWSCSTWAIPCGLPYSVDIYKGKEVKGFIFSSYYHMNIIDLEGNLHDAEQKILPGMWLYNVMGNSLDLNGDGCGDAISRALWGHVNLYDGKTGKVDYFANLKGRLVAWRIFKGKDMKPDLLVLTKDGMGLYDAHIRKELLCKGFPGAPDEDALLVEKRSQREIWSKRFEATAIGFVGFNGKLVVAHASGFISIYSLEGQFVKKLFVGKTIKNIAKVKLKNKVVVLVNTGRKIVLLNANLEKVKKYDLLLKNIYVLDERILIAIMPDNSAKRIELD